MAFTLFFAGFLSLWVETPEALGTLHVISDLDETIKISKKDDLTSIIRFVIREDLAYPGMVEMVNAWKGEHKDLKISFLSNSPSWARPAYEDFFAKYPFPGSRVIFRDYFRHRNRFRYKRRKLFELARETDHPLILLGDNLEDDPKVYDFFRRKCPKRVLKIYIHQVAGDPARSLVEETNGLVPIHSAITIAAHEIRAGRLKMKSGIALGKSILGSPELGILEKNLDHCPPHPPPLDLVGQGEFDGISRSIHGRIFRRCRCAKALANGKAMPGCS